MKKSLKGLLLAAMAAVGCTSSAYGVGNVVIAEVYGAGGNNGALFNADYVVLFNRSAVSQTMTNWSVQYGSQTGPSAAWSKAGPINGTIPAGGYFLVRVSTTGANGAALTPDASFTTISASANNGKFALVNADVLLPNATPCPLSDPSIVDFVQFGIHGASGQCGEGGVPTGTALGVTTAATRNGNGCVDTDNNGSDFTTGTPNPKNASSPVNVCGGGTSGACCTGVSTCNVVASAGACGGTFIGAGSTCSPTNPCLPPTGACCETNTNCTVVSQADCTTLSGVWTQGGACTPNNPCVGSCCIGTSCTLTSAAGCPNGGYTLAGVCTPNPCPADVAYVVGDVAYGASVSALNDSVPHVRDNAGNGDRVGTNGRFAFPQSVRFDNAGGGNHNPNGNLLGLNFGGTQAAGAELYNLATNGNGLGEKIFTLNGTLYGLAASRAGGLSVSPDNTRVAMIGTDSARVVVLNYSAGGTVGTGAGASITGGHQSDPSTLPFVNAQTSGTAWLDNNTLILYINAADLVNFIVGPSIWTIPVDAAGNLGTPTFRAYSTITGFAGTSRFYAISYNPAISPFAYAMASDFVSTPAPGVSTTLLSVFNVSTWTEIKSVNLSTTLETGRELAIGADKNLYLGQFAGSTFLPTSALVDRLDLDLNNDNTIDATDTAGLTDNSSTNWYLKGVTQVTSSFTGLDIAVSAGAPTTGACCLANGMCSVTTSGACIGGTFQGLGTSCTPNPCPQPSTGRCCIGSRCAIVAAASCTASGTAGVSFTAGASNCNNAGVFNTPCCFADYNKVGGVGVQDIFDFLAGWFANSVNANVQGDGIAAPGVQDIFDFLAAWFAGGC